MRRLPVVVGGCARCRTGALLFLQHEASYCCPTGVLLFFQQHAAAYCSPHPPSTARQARGRTSGTPDRTRGSLYVSLLHPPITARQARGPHQRNIRTRAWLSFCELTAPTDQDSASKGLHQRDTIEGARLSLGERSSPHRPSTARQARDRTIFLGQAPCCSFRVMNGLLFLTGMPLRFFQQHEATYTTYCCCRWMRSAIRSAA